MRGCVRAREHAYVRVRVCVRARARVQLRNICIGLNVFLTAESLLSWLVVRLRQPTRATRHRRMRCSAQVYLIRSDPAAQLKLAFAHQLIFAFTSFLAAVCARALASTCVASV